MGRARLSSLTAVVGAAAALGGTAVSNASPSRAANTGVVVASGHWDGHAWSLRASDDASGRHCLQISVDFPFTRYAPPRMPNCGGSATFSSFAVCPLAFVNGQIASAATKITITLASGATVRTSTITPPSRLSQDVRYFVTRIPCGSRVTSLVGTDASGDVVARFPLR